MRKDYIVRIIVNDRKIITKSFYGYVPHYKGITTLLNGSIDLHKNETITCIEIEEEPEQ